MESNIVANDVWRICSSYVSSPTIRTSVRKSLSSTSFVSETHSLGSVHSRGHLTGAALSRTLPAMLSERQHHAMIPRKSMPIPISSSQRNQGAAAPSEADSVKAVNDMRMRLSNAYDRPFSLTSRQMAGFQNSSGSSIGNNNNNNQSCSSNTTSFASESFRRIYERQVSSSFAANIKKEDEEHQEAQEASYGAPRNLVVRDATDIDAMSPFDRLMLSRQSSRSCSFHDDEACIFTFDL